MVGNNLLSLGRHQEALNYFEHAIAMGERYGFYNNLSDVYISLVDLYAYFKEYEKAREAGEMALKYARFLNNNFMLMRSYLSIGNLQILEGKFLSAVQSLENCIDIATPEFGDKFYLSLAYERLGKAYAGSHNYKDAYEAFARYDRFKNEVYTEDANQKISLLQTEFDFAQKESTIQGMESRLKRQRSGQLFTMVIAGLLLLLLVVLYVTYQNNRRKNILLEHKNDEKEYLLKEIHHRVKNNLGIVSSLLDLQAEGIKDPKVIEALQESRNRVYSMSMIHQQLYQGKDLSSIGMKEYLIDLSQHISDSFGAKERISFTYELDNFDLDVDQAIPVGLVVNELLTNSFKHAFSAFEKGEISISFVKKNEERLILEVADNGCGMQVDGSINEESTGFGTQLIELLIHQLDGSMMVVNGVGTKVSVEFDLDIIKS